MKTRRCPPEFTTPEHGTPEKCQGKLRMATPDVVSNSQVNNVLVLISPRLLDSYLVWADSRRRPDWNGNKWSHLRRVSMFYDETEEGGCTTTVHADKPRKLHGVHETDATYKLSNEQDKRISINELSENLNGKLI